MTGFPYLIYDVFTDTPFTGNPLAVFLDASGLPEAKMPQIANELNLSETVFITARDEGDGYTLRIFTPQTELPFAGHPTIGAGCALREAGVASGSVKLILKAGAVTVSLDEGGASFVAPHQSVQFEVSRGTGAAARLLGLNPVEILAVRGGDAGVPFAFIELISRKVLSQCRISSLVWKAEWAESNAPHIYTYYREPNGTGIHARMFAPAMGITEDPATGGAAAALAAVLPNGDYLITQGEDMGRKSEIRLGVRENLAEIGGSAVLVGRGEIFVP